MSTCRLQYFAHATEITNRGMTRGICGDPGGVACSNALQLTAVGVAATIVIATVYLSKTPARAALAAWLMASSTLKLIWGVPVLGDYFHTLADVVAAADRFEWIYTRQVYVVAEIAALNLGLYCKIRPYPPTAYAASAYWLTALWLAVQYWDNAGAPLYTLHDVGGLFMSLVWFYAGPPTRASLSPASKPTHPKADDGDAGV